MNDDELQTPAPAAEVGPPDFDPVIRPVVRALGQWFPKSNQLAREELARAVVHRVLQVEHVEGNIWLANAWYDPSGAPPDEGSLVDQTYLLIRAWLPDDPASKCLEAAGAAIHDVLCLDHVLGELWSVHLPEATTGQGEVNR